jgi:hypothetical protein
MHVQCLSWLAHGGKRLRRMSTVFSSRHGPSDEDQDNDNEPARRRGERTEHTKGNAEKYDVADAIGVEVCICVLCMYVCIGERTEHTKGHSEKYDVADAIGVEVWIFFACLYVRVHA